MIILDRLYFSEKVNIAYKFEYDKNCKKRPSWLEFKNLPKNVQFIKILINEESFWYRRYFENYFFPLNSSSEDYEYYYDKIGNEYEGFVPHNKELGKYVLSFLKKLKIKKDESIAEFFVGTGMITESLVSSGYKNITLIDISKKCLEISKNKLVLRNCKFIHTDILTFLSDKKYDLIIQIMSPNSFSEERIEKLLSSTERNLTKNGKIIIINRHISHAYQDHFKKIDSGVFFFNGKDKLRYEYFIGKLD